MKNLQLLFFFLAFSLILQSQNFNKLVLLNNYYGREAKWGDFDRDGDLDILTFYTFEDAYGAQFTRILENQEDTFIVLDVGLPVVERFGTSRNGSVNWIDFDNDGFLDVFIVIGASFSAKIKIFKNNGDKTFTDIHIDSTLSFVPQSFGPSFADFDNDGDLDILLSGLNWDIFEHEAKLFENTGSGGFVDVGLNNITGVIKSRMPWVDFNDDGYIDFVANEINEDYTSNISIYKNNGDKTFTKIIYDNLPGLNGDYANPSGDQKWGDYNNDGFADLLISGANTSSNGYGITRIYKNNGDETFTDIGINSIYGMAMDVSIEWGDYNNDGILDILQTGDGFGSGVPRRTRIFYNKDGTFEEDTINIFLKTQQCGMSAGADYDNDSDLDFIDLGRAPNYNQIALFNNSPPNTNSKPNAPTNLMVDKLENEVILKWDRASDNETPYKGLSYNVSLRRGSSLIISPAALETGKRTIVSIGNAQYNNFYKIKNLPSGTYTWTVQSIDNCYEASEFAPENTFEYVNNGIIAGENSNIQKIVAYPNPFSTYVTLKSNNSNIVRCSFTISDLTGRVLLRNNDVLLPYGISCVGLSKGLFLLTVIQDNSAVTKKIEKK